MIREKYLKTLAGLSTVLMILTVLVITISGPEDAGSYHLFELLGSSMALIVTTYGIFLMQKHT